MPQIIAVDPGYTIGLAYYDLESKQYAGEQVSTEERALEWIDHIATSREFGAGPYDFALVENYQSAGNLTKEAKHTIELIGVFRTYFKHVWDIECKLPAPQRRLSGVAEAQTLAPEFKSYERNGRDVYAALAHCMVAAREYTIE